MIANRIRVTDLPGSVSASRFEGEQHGATVSFFLSRNQPGTGASLHTHPYDETFIVEHGTVTFTVGDEQVEATGGDILIVPAGTAHGFVNSGSTALRQISIHPTPHMEAEWLD